jgi:hypothetical protein
MSSELPPSNEKAKPHHAPSHHPRGSQPRWKNPIASASDGAAHGLPRGDPSLFCEDLKPTHHHAALTATRHARHHMAPRTMHRMKDIVGDVTLRNMAFATCMVAVLAARHEMALFCSCAAHIMACALERKPLNRQACDGGVHGRDSTREPECALDGRLNSWASAPGGATPRKSRPARPCRHRWCRGSAGSRRPASHGRMASAALWGACVCESTAGLRQRQHTRRRAGGGR